MRFSTKRLGIYEQAAIVRVNWPNFSTKVRSGTLRCLGELCPSPLSESYFVEIVLDGRGIPEVQVRKPKLVCRSVRDTIPHMYDQERLCLYTPGLGEWESTRPIATTIIPWTSLWLYYYEIWHGTGEWLGGGHEPSDSPLPIEKRERKNRDEYPNKPR